MVSKRNVIVAVLLVIVLLISSEVADAKEMAETSNRARSMESEKIDGEVIGTDDYGCGSGCCGSTYGGYCRCCR
ncbi:hypothetical protein AAHA92_16655 [Salvia divinorum]|uniref:Uncharacterized protein n=1 Tax=Salvia divinorum TaxID=28513 RepID=A0ABD1GWE9_SALDI